jgi:lipopolysaccharide export system protein LptA
MSDDGKTLHKGDKVTWRSHGNEVHGTVEEKITERTEAAGRTVDASADDPQYTVQSDKTGREAVHEPGALKRGE